MSGYLNELIRDNEDFKEAVRNVEKTSKTAKVHISQREERERGGLFYSHIATQWYIRHIKNWLVQQSWYMYLYVLESLLSLTGFIRYPDRWKVQNNKFLTLPWKNCVKTPVLFENSLFSRNVPFWPLMNYLRAPLKSSLSRNSSLWYPDNVSLSHNFENNASRLLSPLKITHLAGFGPVGRFGQLLGSPHGLTHTLRWAFWPGQSFWNQADCLRSEKNLIN